MKMAGLMLWKAVFLVTLRVPMAGYRAFVIMLSARDSEQLIRR